MATITKFSSADLVLISSGSIFVGGVLVHIASPEVKIKSSSLQVPEEPQSNKYMDV